MAGPLPRGSGASTSTRWPPRSPGASGNAVSMTRKEREMIDIPSQLAAIHREVGAGDRGRGEAVGVVLRRSYPAAIEDVWDAVTDPDRLKRWFLPVSGDLRVGGTSSSRATPAARSCSCEPPRAAPGDLRRPDQPRRAAPVAERRRARRMLELEHTVPIEIARQRRRRPLRRARLGRQPSWPGPLPRRPGRRRPGRGGELAGGPGVLQAVRARLDRRRRGVRHRHRRRARRGDRRCRSPSSPPTPPMASGLAEH